MFDKTIRYAINVSLDVYSILIVAVILFSVFTGKSRRVKGNSWFIGTLLASLVMIISDIFTWLCEGTARPSYSIILPVANFVYYISTIAVLGFFSFFILDTIGGYYMTKKYRYPIIIAIAIYLVFLIAGIFTEVYFYIDEYNVYHRGKFFFIGILIEIYLYCILVVSLIDARRIINFKKLIPLIAFIVLPQSMQIIQLVSYGIALINTGYALTFMIIFLNNNRTLEKSLDYSVAAVRQKETQIIQMQDHIIMSLSSLVEDRDTDTGGHVNRTASYVELLATQLMKTNRFPRIIDEKYITYLEKAAPMHDIGKILVSDSILKKPERLSDSEYKEMQLHASEGGRIVVEVLDKYEDREYIQITNDMAQYHHEKWNGTGYPKGLIGEEIPLAARIMAVADVFDALVSPRVYKSPMSYDDAFSLMKAEAGSHFDPIIIEEFLSIKDKVIDINENYKRLQKAQLMMSLSDSELEELEEVDDLEELESI